MSSCSALGHCSLGRYVFCVTYSVWSVAFIDFDAVEEEANGGTVFALALAEGAHQFVQLSGSLDFEEDFIVVVRDLDIEVLSRGVVLLRTIGRLLVVGHLERKYCSRVRRA